MLVARAQDGAEGIEVQAARQQQFEGEAGPIAHSVRHIRRQRHVHRAHGAAQRNAQILALMLGGKHRLATKVPDALILEKVSRNEQLLVVQRVQHAPVQAVGHRGEIGQIRRHNVGDGLQVFEAHTETIDAAHNVAPFVPNRLRHVPS